MAESSSQSGSPGREVISLGAHTSEVDGNMSTAAHDQLFTPLMVDAGMIPETLRGSRILPGVTYGIDATRPTPFGAVELLPGSNALMLENLGTEQFNPHLSVRTRAHNLVDALQSGKGSQRVRGRSFGLPSYLLDSRGTRSLFVGGAESDLDIMGEEFAEKLAIAYDIGNVVLGSEVVVGDLDVNLGHVSLPTIVREIGHDIIDFDVSHDKRVKILKEAHKKFEEGKSPDYRPYLKTRIHWPANRARPK